MAKGRRLAVPSGPTRPTPDRVREALFSSLLAEQAGQPEQPLGNFLDLFAGSGAVGLEALSRGASAVLLVEHHRQALAVIRRNIDVVGLPGVSYRAEPVGQFAARPATERYQTVFADPPYVLAAAELADILMALHGNGWLAADALVVVERASRDPEWVWPSPYEAVRHRRYGEVTLWYGRRVASENRETSDLSGLF